jgi:hypothetical protein
LILPNLLEEFRLFELLRPFLLLLLPWLAYLCLGEKTEAEEAPNVDLPTPFPWRNLRSRRKRYPRNYYLRKRIERRAIKRLHRDPARKWYKPSTWKWERTVPIPKPSSYAWSRRPKQKKNSRERPWPKRRRRPPPTKGVPKREDFLPRDQNEEFTSERHRMLHFSDVMYGFQYGVDLTAFVADLDPLKQFHSLVALSSTNFLTTSQKSMKDESTDVVQTAFSTTAASPVPIHLLVHNAGAYGPPEEFMSVDGMYKSQTLDDVTMERMRFSYEINTLAPLRLTKALLPNLREASQAGDEMEGSQ